MRSGQDYQAEDGDAERQHQQKVRTGATEGRERRGGGGKARGREGRGGIV